MSKEVIDGPVRPLGAYSHAIKAGPFVFVTGTTPHDPSSGLIEASDLANQTGQVIANMEAVLSAGGASLDDVVKVTVHLLDVRLFPEFDAVYRARFRAPYPARTTVGSDMRQVPGMLVEMDCTAYLGGEQIDV